jgi:hypothetical protein
MLTMERRDPDHMGGGGSTPLPGKDELPMGQASALYAKSKQKDQPKPKEKKLSGQERLALKKMRREARLAGATLDNDGKGGLPPSLVLGRMRKDGFRCSNVKCPDPKKNITVDHISGHPKEIAEDKGARGRKDLRKGVELGHIDTLDAIHTLCARCHDAVHDREREIEHDEQPEPMPGRKGSK